jgi:hypothetical protein
MSRRDGWRGVDFDKTLAYYDGYKGHLVFGDPIPKMLERVKRWVANGEEVRIFTARVAPQAEPDGTPRDVEAIRKGIEDWTEKHVGKRLQVTNIKDHKMFELWDDRAVQVVPNTGERIRKEEPNSEA